jgi:hypothetical protein
MLTAQHAAMDATKFQRFFRNIVYSKKRTPGFGDLSYLLDAVCPRASAVCVALTPAQNYQREMRALADRAVVAESPAGLAVAQREALASSDSSAPPVVMGLFVKEDFAEWAGVHPTLGSGSLAVCLTSPGADALGVWPYPRTHHRRTLLLPPANAPLLLLADRRHSPYVPSAYRIRPAEALQARKSAEVRCDRL